MVKVVSIIEPKGCAARILVLSSKHFDCLRETFEANEADTIIPTINRAGLL